MRVLVIGGCGRVAGWVIPYLRPRHEITVFDRLPAADIVGNALSPGDVAAAMKEVDAVVHLAVVVPRGVDQSDPDVLRDAWAVNVGSWWVALEQGRLAGVRTFVYGSTMSVYARFGVELMPEASTQDPDAILPYGASKRAAEALGESYARQFGLRVTSLRLGFPAPDEIAPAWLRPATGEITQIKLKDGTVMPSAPASHVAGFVERALAFSGTYQALNVTAPDTPWA